MWHPDYDRRAASELSRQRELDSLLRDRVRRQQQQPRARQQSTTLSRPVVDARPAIDARPAVSVRTVASRCASRTLGRPLSSSDFINRRPQTARVKPVQPAFDDTGRGSSGAPSGTRHARDRFAADRLDIDSLSYEQLLALQERVGFVHVGVPRDILSTFPVWRAKETSGIECAVCFDVADGQSVFRCLPCRHRFHRDCIDPWLEKHKTCPVCKSDVTE